MIRLGKKAIMKEGRVITITVSIFNFAFEINRDGDSHSREGLLHRKVRHVFF